MRDGQQNWLLLLRRVDCRLGWRWRGTQPDARSYSQFSSTCWSVDHIYKNAVTLFYGDVGSHVFATTKYVACSHSKSCKRCAMFQEFMFDRSHNWSHLTYPSKIDSIKTTFVHKFNIYGPISYSIVKLLKTPGPGPNLSKRLFMVFGNKMIVGRLRIWGSASISNTNSKFLKMVQNSVSGKRIQFGYEYSFLTFIFVAV